MSSIYGPPWPERGHGRRTATLLLLSLLVVAGAVTTVVVGNGDAAPRATAGTFLDQLNDDHLAYTSTVQLPWGALQISAGRPTTTITGFDAYSKRYEAKFGSIRPPLQGSWLPLRFAPRSTGGPVSVDLHEREPATVVRVVDGSRSITVPVPHSEDVSDLQFAEGYLALPWRPTDPHLQISYGSTTQDVYPASHRVRAGSAAPLYAADVHRDLDVVCSTGVVAGFRIVDRGGKACRLEELFVQPYVIGLGWARPGHRWLTVRTYPAPPARVTSGAHSGEDALVSDLRDSDTWTPTMTYGTRSPVDTRRVPDSEFLGGDAFFVFDVGAGDVGRAAPFVLKIRFTTSTLLDYDGPTLTAARTLRVPA